MTIAISAIAGVHVSTAAQPGSPAGQTGAATPCERPAMTDGAIVAACPNVDFPGHTWPPASDAPSRVPTLPQAAPSPPAPQQPSSQVPSGPAPKADQKIPATTPPTAARLGLIASGPLVIDGKSDVSLTGLRITSTSGDCVVIRNSARVTITNSEIGPCKGRGVEISRSSDVRLINNYIHPEFPVSGCCDRGDGVFAYLTDSVLLQDNLIAYGETNIELMGVTNSRVTGNHLLNPLGPHPRGQQVQIWAHGGVRSNNIIVEGNFALAAPQGYKFTESQQDAMNVGFSDYVTFRANHIRGGRSASGCGIVVDQAANNTQILNNTLVDTGQCGIGVGSGINQNVEGNRVFNHGIDLPGAGNTALYVWRQYAGACGPVRFANNTAVLVRTNGQLSSYWNGGGCDAVTQTGNVFDQPAVDALSPVAVKMPPLPVPSLPAFFMNPDALSYSSNVAR